MTNFNINYEVFNAQALYDSEGSVYDWDISNDAWRTIDPNDEAVQSLAAELGLPYLEEAKDWEDFILVQKPYITVYRYN